MESSCGAPPNRGSTFIVSAKQNAALYAYYRKVMAREGYFRRRDFDPLDVPQLLPHLALARVERDEAGERALRWSVFGTYLVEQLGWDLTGRCLSREVIGDNFDRIIPLYRRVLEERRPVLSVELLEMPGRAAKRVEVLHLPMRDAEGVAVEQVLIGWCVLDHRDSPDPLQGDKVTWSIDAVACDGGDPSAS